MHEVGTLWNVDKTHNAFLIIGRLKATAVKHGRKHSLSSLVKH